MYYNPKLIIERVKQLPDFKEKLFNGDYWICGVRSETDEPNKFDDTFYLFKGEECIIDTTGTTNPGTPVLKGGYLKYNKDGAAVVESDRIYWNVWKYGKHGGKIPALKQLGNKITIWRDGDGDNKSEEIGKRTEGYYGINFHSDEYDINEDNRSDDAGINGWSAGCQVCNKMHDYKRIINLTKDQKNVSYVLLKEFSV